MKSLFLYSILSNYKTTYDFMNMQPFVLKLYPVVWNKVQWVS